MNNDFSRGSDMNENVSKEGLVIKYMTSKGVEFGPPTLVTARVLDGSPANLKSSFLSDVLAQYRNEFKRQHQGACGDVK